MAGNERVIDRGRRRSDAMVRKVVDELRAARITAGFSQRRVGHAAGLAQSEVSRIERGERVDVAVSTLIILAEAVGMELSVRAYPGARRVLDAPQLGVLRRLRVFLGPGWLWRFEARVAPGEQRAWDAWARHRVTGVEVVFEVETRMTDVQAFLRRISLKRAVAPVRLIVVAPDTRQNRAVVREWRDILSAEFPCSARRCLTALAAGRDPGADALIILPTLRRSRATTTDGS